MNPSTSRTSIGLLVALTLAASGFAVYQHGQLGDQASRIAALQKTIAARDVSLADARIAAQKIEAENKALDEESATLRNKLASQIAPEVAPVSPESTPTPAEPEKKNPFGSMMEKMMKNPKMLDAIAAQQMAVLKPMYADLVKQLKLTPEETAQFYDLLGKQTSQAMQAGMKMMSGDKNAIKDLTNASKDEMKTLLGDRYSQYETYQKTIPDRAMLSQISSQMAARQLPLRTDQSNGLLQIMQQEKLNTAKFTAANTDPQKPDFSAKALDDTINATEERNTRILAKAKTLLTPEQWNAFADQQKQTLQMQKMGMEMAKGMMSGPSK
ncbi:MAG: hypothetical protein ABIT76_12420 [Chthoniobacterales bacterium]